MNQTRIPQGGLNLDDTMEMLSPEDWIYGKNITFGRTPSGANGTIENTRGTSAALTGTADLDANSTCIGAVKDKADNETYLFFHNTDEAKHTIVKVSGTTVSKVMTWSGLDFQLTNRIVGAAKINDLLYWTDNYNEPRVINVNTFVTTAPVLEEEITLIRRPGAIPPTFIKSVTEDDDQIILSNRVKNYDFQFAYQYVYEDGQEAVLSPFSKLAYRNVEDEDYRRVRVYIPVVEAAVQWQSGVDYDNWITATDYVFSDIVFYNSVYYKCALDHTAGTFATDLTAQKWIKYSPKWDSKSGDQTELFPKHVKEVAVAVRQGNAGAWAFFDRIKVTNDKMASNWSDFYNTTNGLVVRTGRSNAYDVVPQKAEALAIAKDRLFVGNILEGYDTPDTAISANFASEQFDGTDTRVALQPQIIKVIFHEWLDPQTPEEWANPWAEHTWWYDEPITTYNPSGTGRKHFVYINDGWVRLASSTGVDPSDFTVDLVGYDGYSSGQVIAYSDQFVDETQIPGDYTTYEPEPAIYLPSTVNLISSTSQDYSDYYKTRTFTSGSSQRIGKIYFDGYGRKSGVDTNSDCVIKIPFDEYGLRHKISWTIQNDTNIPFWATHYAIVATKNLSKTWFSEGYTSHILYRVKNADGTYSTQVGPHDDMQQIQIDLRGWSESGRGYNYTEGDRIVIYDIGGVPGNTFDLEILDTEGYYVICPYEPLFGASDLPTGASNYGNFRFEIYTPAKDNLTDVFYMIGVVYPIINPGTVEPSHSVKTGELDGDATLVNRDRYEYVADLTDLKFKETNIMKAIPDDVDEDDYYVWNTDVGHAFVEDYIGQRRLDNYFRWSSTIIENTLVNGLSEFIALDISNTSAENGTLRKLQITQKAQSEGTILLAICEAATSTIFIGERPINVSDGTSFMAMTTDVVSQVNTQKRRFGTLNPESVFEKNGDVYWWDKLNRTHVRYGIHNGLFPISDYKAVSYFEEQAVLNPTGLVRMGIDPYYKTIYTTFDAASSSEKKTIAFNNLRNRYVGFADFAPDYYFESIDKMYSVIAGSIYVHDSSTKNTFYGTEYESVIELSMSDTPIQPKDWLTVGLAVSPSMIEWVAGIQQVKTDAVRVDITNKHGQATSLINTDFEVNEGVIYSDILKDANTAVANPLIYGDDINSETVQVKVTMKSTADISLFYTIAGYIASAGHTL